jgi:O-6-methylguanine DNA methyltransferase
MNHFEIIENSAELFYTEKKTAKEVAIALNTDEKKIIAAWELGLKINPETLLDKINPKAIQKIIAENNLEKNKKNNSDIQIIRMENSNEKLDIDYSFQPSPFGEILVASTKIGICQMTYFEDKNMTLQELQASFPHANILEKTHDSHLKVVDYFSKKKNEKIKLHIKGTDFQMHVWIALLKLNTGELTSYNQIAKEIGNPKASRAVGTAIGSNSIAYLLPCHRVVKTDGIIGGYKWKKSRKIAMIAWEI